MKPKSGQAHGSQDSYPTGRLIPVSEPCCKLCAVK